MYGHAGAVFIINILSICQGDAIGRSYCDPLIHPAYYVNQNQVQVYKSEISHYVTGDLLPVSPVSGSHLYCLHITCRTIGLVI